MQQVRARYTLMILMLPGRWPDSVTVRQERTHNKQLVASTRSYCTSLDLSVLIFLTILIGIDKSMSACSFRGRSYMDAWS